MTTASEKTTFTVPANSSAYNIGDADVQTVTVPAGEIWYVEAVAYDALDSAGGNPDPYGVYWCIVATDEPVQGGNLKNLTRGGGNTNGDVKGDSISLGLYAYGGDTIRVGIDGTSNECLGYLLIRRVL